MNRITKILLLLALMSGLHGAEDSRGKALALWSPDSKKLVLTQSKNVKF